MVPSSAYSLVFEYKKSFDNQLKEYLDKKPKTSRLHAAHEYALLNGGKRLRPIIVLMSSYALKNYPVFEAALSVELFHTASLIADDLPCMDNDDVRRKMLATHKQFDESTALLASYAMIAEGYDTIQKNAESLYTQYPSQKLFWCERLCEAIKHISLNAGIEGICLGQFLDLHLPPHNREALEQIILKKTITLFESAFLLGWIFGGGDLSQLNDVKRLAYHLGMAFQILDDLNDEKQDRQQKNIANFVHLLGVHLAQKTIYEHLSSYQEMAQKLFDKPEPLIALSEVLQEKAALEN